MWHQISVAQSADRGRGTAAVHQHPVRGDPYLSATIIDSLRSVGWTATLLGCFTLLELWEPLGGLQPHRLSKA